MTEQLLSVRGIRLRVSLEGDGRPPLLLLNGIGASLEMWRPLREHLALPTLAIDAPGTGGSGTPVRPLRMRGLAELLVAALDELGIGRVDVLGYSFGGALAQQLALDAPARVRRLVLASTTAGVLAVPGSPWALMHMMSPLRYRSRSYLLHAVPAISGGRIAREPEILVRHAEDRLAAPPTFWGYGSQVYAMSWWTSAWWLHRITRPTLVLAGDDDPLVPLANARFLARRIPAARLHVVSGGGHLVLVDQPEDVARILTSFLDPVETT